MNRKAIAKKKKKKKSHGKFEMKIKVNGKSIHRPLASRCMYRFNSCFLYANILVVRSINNRSAPFPPFPVDRAPHLLSIEHLRWPENALRLSAFTVSIRFSPATMFCLRNYRKYRKNSYETTVKNARRKLGNWIEWNGMLNDKIVGVIESKRRRGGR